MTDFFTLFNSYKNYQPAKYSSYPVEFIKRGILSIFDRQNSSESDIGSISEKEFNSVTEEQYKKYVSQMEKYCKTNNMKELEYHIPTYYELKEMLKGGESTPMGNKIITPNEIQEAVLPDAKIGQANQGRSGNCYQIASDTALDTNESGRLALKLSIQKYWDPVKNGYYVTLYGAKDKDGNVKPRTYFISQRELKEAQETYVDMGDIDKNGKITIEKNAKKYTSGDPDIVLLDIATEKYRKETGYRIPYNHTKKVQGYDDYLSAGKTNEQMELISGKEGKVEYYSQKISVESTSRRKTNKKIKKTMTVNDKTKIRQKLKYIKNNSNVVSATAGFEIFNDGSVKEFEQYGLIERHAFTIKSIDYNKNTVMIIDPHFGKNQPIILPMNIFEKYCSSIKTVDLTKPIASNTNNYKKDNPQAKKVAQDIYNQISGPSRNKVTIRKLRQIDKYNAAQVIQAYRQEANKYKRTRGESLAEAINNEWGLDIKTVKQYVCTPLIQQASILGIKVDTDKYVRAKDIKSLNNFINLLIGKIYQKLK